jgi:hypothetical protein
MRALTHSFLATVTLSVAALNAVAQSPSMAQQQPQQQQQQQQQQNAPYFQVNIPEGWVTRLTRPDGERVTFHNQTAAFTVMPRDGKNASSELQALVQQMRGSWRNTQMGGAGQFDIAAQPSKYKVIYQDFNGQDPQGVQSQARVSMIQAGPRLVALVATSSQDSLRANGPALEQLHNSLRFNPQWLVSADGYAPAPAPSPTSGFDPMPNQPAMRSPSNAAFNPGGGFQVVPSQAGSGMALVKRGSGERSARQLTQNAVQALGASMDRPPKLLGGMVSKEDDEAMLSFVGHQGGQIMQGYVVAKLSQNNYTVAVAMDDPKRLTRSGSALLAAVDPAMANGGRSGAGGGGNNIGPSPYKNITWKRVPFGSGTLEMPSDWNVVGQSQGAVDIVGPRGEVLGLGSASQVITPEAARLLPLPPQMYVAPATTDPITAFRSVQPQMERMALNMGRPVVRMGRVHESDRIQFPGFNAALIASDGIGSVGNKPYRKLSLVAAGPVLATGTWVYYTSEVYAPTELYPHALPVMLKIWNSWTVDKKVLMERLVAASNSMRETQDILKGIHADGAASRDRINAGWGQQIRGTVTVADNNTGKRSEEWLYQPGPASNGVGTEHNRHMDTVVRDANAAAGYERWQTVKP